MIKLFFYLFLGLLFIGCSFPDDWLWCIPMNTPILF